MHAHTHKWIKLVFYIQVSLHLCYNMFDGTYGISKNMGTSLLNFVPSTITRHNINSNSHQPIIYNKPKPRYVRFRLECPMPIALRTPSRALSAYWIGIYERLSPSCAVLLAGGCCAVQPSRHRPLQLAVQPSTVRTCLRRVENSSKMLIFFPTMTPIDKRPSPSVAQHRLMSACKISPPYVTPFQRR